MEVESINQHFLTIAHKTTDDLPFLSTSPLSYISVSDILTMMLAEVGVSEVYRYLCDLNFHKAMGVDNIPTRFINASPGGMAVLLTRLINKSITSHVFPAIWKNAVVVPVKKSVQSSSLSQSLFYLFFPKFWKGLFMIKLFVSLLHTTFFQIDNLVFVLGIQPKMCYYMSVIHGLG